MDLWVHERATSSKLSQSIPNTWFKKELVHDAQSLSFSWQAHHKPNTIPITFNPFTKLKPYSPSSANPSNPLLSLSLPLISYPHPTCIQLLHCIATFNATLHACVFTHPFPITPPPALKPHVLMHAFCMATLPPLGVSPRVASTKA